jgi:hypothetical protein
MTLYLPDEVLEDSLIDQMMLNKIFGGQDGEGKQLPGFFEYKEQKPVSVYSLDESQYVPISEQARLKILGPLPEQHRSWKNLLRNDSKKELLEHYFANLYMANTLGADLARSFLSETKRIAEHLVKSGVAQTMNDVDTVLINGFYHLHGVREIPNEER